MQIKVHTQNIHLSQRMEEYVNKKVERLDRYLPHISSADMELRSEGRSEQPVAQLTIRSERGLIFRVEDKKQEDIYAAIDTVVDKMYRQLRRHKTKVQRNRKGGNRWVDVEAEEIAIPALADESPEIEETEVEEVVERDVVRRKHIALLPMNEEEAVMQAEMLGHDFFVFLNGDTGVVNVLYQRDDGNYGILIAEAD